MQLNCHKANLESMVTESSLVASFKAFDNFLMRSFILFWALFPLCYAVPALSQESSRAYLYDRPSRWTYDVGAAVGNDQIGSYTEFDLGANWYRSQWLSWRNALFTRFGENYRTLFGLNTSFRGEANFYAKNSSFGAQAYAGPGLQVATLESSAGFAEAGLVFKIGSIYIGGGVKRFRYFQDRSNTFGRFLAKDETQTFLTLSSGGTF